MIPHKPGVENRTGRGKTLQVASVGQWVVQPSQVASTGLLGSGWYRPPRKIINITKSCLHLEDVTRTRRSQADRLHCGL